MDISMPLTFPEGDFRAFGIAASAFFPSVASDEALFDPQEKRRQFDWSWQAVRYRYRGCFECNGAFKALLDDEASAWWKGGGSDEEVTYKLERCIYQFFTSGLSVFDSLAFCLYFYGGALKPDAFPDVSNPRSITWKRTAKAFRRAFPQAAITGLLASTPQDASFHVIDEVRNLLAHRISGRRSIRSSGTLQPDRMHTTDWHEETWHIPGAAGKLMFDQELLERQLNDITRLLTSLSSAAREFAESQKAAKEAKKAAAQGILQPRRG
jgi:hypothetical protein